MQYERKPNLNLPQVPWCLWPYSLAFLCYNDLIACLILLWFGTVTIFLLHIILVQLYGTALQYGDQTS